MPGDHSDIVMSMVDGSLVLRARQGALVQVYSAGTDTQVWEGVTNNSGVFTVPVLATGKYDIKVDGQTVKTIHHVKADHTHKPDLPWLFTKDGAITADQDEVNTMPVYGTGAAGSLAYVMVCAESVDATGDVTVHLLKGPKSGASGLTVVSNSVWSHQINPGSAENRYLYDDENPGVSIAADECVTLGINHSTNAVAGLTVLAVFRPE